MTARTTESESRVTTKELADSVSITYRLGASDGYRDFKSTITIGEDKRETAVLVVPTRKALVILIVDAIRLFSPKAVYIQTSDNGKSHLLSRETVQAISEGRLSATELSVG